VGTLSRAIQRLARFGALAAFVSSTAGVAFQTSGFAVIQQPTPPSAQGGPAAWNPSEGAPVEAHFVGRAVCAECHSSEAETQRSTPMGEAAESAAECETLRNHPRLSFRLGSYTYEIVRKGNGSDYSVGDGKQSITEPVLWVFGKEKQVRPTCSPTQGPTTRVG
jgi:hypothetical protein